MVAAGPYRYLRNPLYVGSWLNTLALAILMRPSGAVFTLVALVGFHLRLILAEEAFLAGEAGGGVCGVLPGCAEDLSETHLSEARCGAPGAGAVGPCGAGGGVYVAVGGGVCGVWVAVQPDAAGGVRAGVAGGEPGGEGTGAGEDGGALGGVGSWELLVA